MADEAPKGTITTETAAKSPIAEPLKVGETGEDTVMVRQLKPYLSGMPDSAEDRRVMDDKPYSVTRRRAGELRASGLAEYVDDKDYEREAEEAGKAAAEKVRGSKFQTKKD